MNKKETIWAGNSFPPPLGSVVFEVIDATNEENYWTLGIFATLEDAVSQLSKCTPDDLPSERDCDDECCRVEVYEHKVGTWGGHGRKVYEHVWNGTWNEEADEMEWVLVSPNVAHQTRYPVV